MTAVELERLAVLETKMDGMDERTARIESKLDFVIREKVDRSEFAATCELVNSHHTSINRAKGALTAVAVVGPVISGVIVALVTHWLVG